MSRAAQCRFRGVAVQNALSSLSTTGFPQRDKSLEDSSARKTEAVKISYESRRVGRHVQKARSYRREKEREGGALFVGALTPAGLEIFTPWYKRARRYPEL